MNESQPTEPRVLTPEEWNARYARFRAVGMRALEDAERHIAAARRHREEIDRYLRSRGYRI